MTPLELALVLGSALLHAVWSAAIKGSGDPLVFNLMQKVAPALLLAATLPFISLGEVPAAVWWLLAGTSVAHGLYFYWMSRAFQEGDLTLVYPIARSAPAFLPLLAALTLGEVLSAPGLIGIAVVVSGIWLVHLDRSLGRGSFREASARFAYLTLAGSVAYSLVDKAAMTALAQAPWSSPVPRPLFFCLLLYVGSAVFFTPLALRRVGARALAAGLRSQLAPASLAAVASLAGYGLILKALETAPVSYVAAVRQTSVLFALVLGMAWLRERPGRNRIVGGVATFVGVALIALSR